jgi:hypothetical protein
VLAEGAGIKVNFDVTSSILDLGAMQVLASFARVAINLTDNGGARPGIGGF